MITPVAMFSVPRRQLLLVQFIAANKVPDPGWKSNAWTRRAPMGRHVAGKVKAAPGVNTPVV